MLVLHTRNPPSSSHKGGQRSDGWDKEEQAHPVGYPKGTPKCIVGQEPVVLDHLERVPAGCHPQVHVVLLGADAAVAHADARDLRDGDLVDVRAAVAVAAVRL